MVDRVGASVLRGWTSYSALQGAPLDTKMSRKVNKLMCQKPNLQNHLPTELSKAGLWEGPGARCGWGVPRTA